MTSTRQRSARPEAGLASVLFRGMSDAALLIEIDATTSAPLRVTDCNPSFERISGLRYDDVVGRRLDELFAQTALVAALRVASLEPLRLTLTRVDQVPVVLLATLLAVGESSSPSDAVLLLREDLVPDRDAVVDSAEQLRLNEARHATLFYDSPLSLWESDCSGLRQELEALRASGIKNVAAWLREDLTRCLPLANAIRVIDVNQGTLDLFGGSSTADFCYRIGELFREDSLPGFWGWVVALAEDKTFYEFDCVLYPLSGQHRLFCRIRTHMTLGPDGKQSKVYTVVTDRTAEVHAELMRDGQRRVLEQLAVGANIEDVLDSLVSEVERQSPFLRCAVFEFNRIDDSLRLVTSSQLDRQLTTELWRLNLERLAATGVISPEFVIHQFDTPPASDAGRRSLGSLIDEAVAQAGYRACACQAVHNVERELVGLVLVFRTEDSQFSRYETDAIASFVRLTGLVLRREQNLRLLSLKTAELESLFVAYPDALLRVSSGGDILERYSGGRMAELLQVSENVPNSLWQMVSDETARDFRWALDRISAGAPSEAVEFRVMAAGEFVSLEARFLPLPHSRDQFVVVRDVSLIKATEAALKSAADHFQQVFDQSPVAIFVETLSGVVLSANQAACELHQMKRDELIGRSTYDLVPRSEWFCIMERSAEMETGALTEFEGLSLRKDGSVANVNVRSSIIEFEGEPAFLLHVRDITEKVQQVELRHRQELRIAHVARLTIMGQLVAGIAHEIRQPMWSAATFADVCREMLQQDDLTPHIGKLRELMGKLADTTRRANEITTRMLSFARKGEPERQTVHMDDLVQAAIVMASPRAKTNNVITRVKAIGFVPKILCDRVLIEQTIVNLLNNAYHALKQRVHGQRKVAITLTSDGTHGCIFVADNGPGLPAGVSAEQLFDSFFTTDRSGMGIGLALSRSFVSDHGGTLRGTTNESGGMTFELTLRIDGKAKSHASSNRIRD